MRYIGVFIFFMLLELPLAFGEPSFSDRDLERYKIKSDSTEAGDNGNNRTEMPQRSDERSSDNSSEQRFWCRRTEQARAMIERAVQDQAAAEEQYRDSEAKFKRKDTVDVYQDLDNAARKVEDAKRAVKDARRVLEEIETEAHQQDIPPGWLKCNFN